MQIVLKFTALAYLSKAYKKKENTEFIAFRHVTGIY